MIGDYSMGAAFPRLMKPPPIPVTPGRGEPHSMSHYHNHMGAPPVTGPRPRDHFAPGSSPIANAIAHQILSNHLNQPSIGLAHAAQMGLNDGLHQALVNSGGGFAGGPPGVPASLASQSPGFLFGPTNPFSRF